MGALLNSRSRVTSFSHEAGSRKPSGMVSIDRQFVLFGSYRICTCPGAYVRFETVSSRFVLLVWFVVYASLLRRSRLFLPVRLCTITKAYDR